MVNYTSRFYGACMVESEAEKFVVLLAKSGTQAAAASELGCSGANVSRRLKIAREVLGDARVLDLIEHHKRDAAAGITLRKSFVMESQTCGVCGSEKIRQPSGRLRCNACRNARYRAAHPLPEEGPKVPAEEAAVSFLQMLAQAGTQEAAAKVLGTSKWCISDRLKKARATLGDERAKELLMAHARDERCRVNLIKPFIINQPVCGKCGGERTPMPSTGELVCRSCANMRNAEYKERHAERVKAAAADYRERNRAELLEKHRAYRLANPGMDAAYYKTNAEALKAKARRYASQNKEKILTGYRRRWREDPKFRVNSRARLRAWKKRNPEKVNAETAKRYATKLRAIPSWANLKDIEGFYALAKLRTKLTGIEWHVDHVVPLNSDIVCGLHCEANLQVIPAGPNISKGNAWWPDMPDAPADCVTFAERPSLYLVPPSTPAPLLTERLLRPALAA